MDWIIDGINDWLRGLLTDGILSSLSNLFDNVNDSVGSIATDVGMTPQGWNSGIFSMIRNISETVVLPIAGMILTAIMCYELISMIIDKNNMHDSVDSWAIFKWIFKTFVAVMVISNTFNIIMGIFEVGQYVVQSSAGVIQGTTSMDLASVVTDLETKLDAMSTGALFGLWFQCLFVGFTMNALNVAIFVVIFGRMIEIYLVTSIGPMPFATFVNREWGQIGNNYLKSLLALAFQALLIMICVAIYSVLVATIAGTDDIANAVWSCMGYTVLLCFTLFKTGSLSKSLFGAH